MLRDFVIRSRAPLRLGFAGGGTDLSPYCDIYGGCVLNSTIDRYAYTTIEKNSDDLVTFYSQEKDFKINFGCKDDIEVSQDLIIHKAVYKYFINKFNNSKNIPLKMSTFCDAPPGSGLGSSSTLVVSMIHAFVELFSVSMDDYEISQLAYHLERNVCGFEGGKQDQYSATFGGFNFMEFGPDNSVNIIPLRVKNWIINELEASTILYFTGISRDSSKIVNEQSRNVSESTNAAIEALHEIKNEAINMKNNLLKGNFEGIKKSLKIGWEEKKKSAFSVSNSHIDKVHNAALDNGALAGRLSGAGGGGFMLFYVPAPYRIKVIETLNQFGGYTTNCHFTEKGSQAWRIPLRNKNNNSLKYKI